MKTNEIQKKLADVALRYQSDILNLQPLEQFANSLQRADDVEVFHGLLTAFKESGYDGDGYFRQEVAGKMFVDRRPIPDMKIEDILAITAPNYNLSVEQLPWYLALAFGRDRFRDAVGSRLADSNLTDREQKSLDTYLYWTGISEEQILAEVGTNSTKKNKKPNKSEQATPRKLSD